MKRSARTASLVVIIGVVALVVAAIGYTAGQNLALTGSGEVASTAEPSMRTGAPAVTQDYAGSIAPESAAKDAAVSAEELAGGSPSPTADSLIIRNASMEMRVDDVPDSIEQLRAAVTRSTGEITDLSVVTGEIPVVPLAEDGRMAAQAGPSTAFVTIRVPSEKLDELQRDVAKLGTVVSQSLSANDVTEEAIDLEARLKNLRAEEARLRAFLNQTDKVSDLLAVERELARVRGEIEAMDAQLTYLERQAARATLSVTLSEPGPVVQPAGPTWGLREAVTRGIQAAANLLTTLVTVSIPLALAAAIAALVVLPVRAIMKRRARRRASETATSLPNDGED